MKSRICLLLTLLFCLPALATPPTDASLEKLLAITKADAIMDTMFGQLQQSIRSGMMAATQGKQLSPEQQKLIDIAPMKVAAAMRQELSWSNLKPVFMQTYREVLDQTEVDGMIAFYETPVGQATIAKMPAIMQKSMSLTQQRLQGLLPRVEAAMREALSEAGVRP